MLQNAIKYVNLNGKSKFLKLMSYNSSHDQTVTFRTYTEQSINLVVSEWYINGNMDAAIQIIGMQRYKS